MILHSWQGLILGPHCYWGNGILQTVATWGHVHGCLASAGVTTREGGLLVEHTMEEGGCSNCNAVAQRLNTMICILIFGRPKNSCQTEHEKCKARQIQKLERLTEKNKSKSSPLKRYDTVGLLGNQLKKWVTNLSKHKLSDQEGSLLQKGLNFAVSCDSIPHEDFIVATEKACSFIPVEDRAPHRAEVAGILRNAKPPPPA